MKQLWNAVVCFFMGCKLVGKRLDVHCARCGYHVLDALREVQLEEYRELCRKKPR